MKVPCAEYFFFNIIIVTNLSTCLPTRAVPYVPQYYPTPSIAIHGFLVLHSRDCVRKSWPSSRQYEPLPGYLLWLKLFHLKD